MAHVARHLAIRLLTRVVEIVALGLCRDSRADRVFERTVVFGMVTQRRAKVRHILLTEAHVDLARAGDADPVAALAEIVGQRCDETDFLAGLAEAHIARRTTRTFGKIGEGVLLGEPGAHLPQRPVLAHPVLAAEIAIGITSMKVRSMPRLSHHST